MPNIKSLSLVGPDKKILEKQFSSLWICNGSEPFEQLFNRIISAKFGQNPISTLGGAVIFKSIVNGRGRRTKTDHKSSPCHYVTGELKK